MAKSETIPVQIDAEKLCKHTLIITNTLNNFPKKYRFTLVDRILRITFDIHDDICNANNSYDMAQRVFYIENCKQPLSADSRAAFPGQSGPY